MKLSNEDVTSIKQRIEAGERPADLAHEYQVSKSLLSLIQSGQRRAVPPKTTRSYTTRKIISLQSGGTVTLSYAVNLFEISESDQAFLLKLIDAMKQYEENTHDYSE